jgi:NADP-dependent 3-hydroxy acid dehydrogenase YdfG
MASKVILVTGATSGIGEVTAKRLAEEGFTVLLTGRNKAGLDKLERELVDKGLRAVAIPADARKENEIRALVDEGLKTFGTINALVHSAGVFTMKSLEETTYEEFKTILETNLDSTFNLLRALLPHFYKQSKGEVVVLSSVLGVEGHPFVGAYSASKWGLQGLLNSVREEAREKGVKVTTICPGPVLTPPWKAYPHEIPEDAILMPEDVAEAVVFTLKQPRRSSVEHIVMKPLKKMR